MGRVTPRELSEADKLLKKVQNWTDNEIEQLPQFYKEKAKEYRSLLQPGEE